MTPREETLTVAHALALEWIVARANEGKFDANAASKVMMPVLGDAVRAHLDRSAVDQLADVGEGRDVLAAFTGVLSRTVITHVKEGRFPPSVGSWLMDQGLIDAIVLALVHTNEI
jgi:hypothetical protein